MATVIEGIKFYTIPETAKALRVTPQTIRAWIKQGRPILTLALQNKAQERQREHFLFTTKDSTMLYSSREYYSGKVQKKNIALEQNLGINNNLTLQYDTISIFTGKQITVQSGYTLTINNCILYACKDMWSGIRLELI